MTLESTHHEPAGTHQKPIRLRQHNPLDARVQPTKIRWAVEQSNDRDVVTAVDPIRGHRRRNPLRAAEAEVRQHYCHPPRTVGRGRCRCTV